MKQPPLFRTTRLAFVALCLVLLQLVTALHFALVPHGFSAGLSGFVHVHAAERATQSRLALLERRGSADPELVNGSATCASDACPIGFAGHHSVLLSTSAASALLTTLAAAAPAFDSPYVTTRSRVLLSAPKTSPPG